MEQIFFETKNSMENNQNGAWGAAANKLAGALADPKVDNRTKGAVLAAFGIGGLIAVGFWIYKLTSSAVDLLKQKG